jgi:glycosyltransferase involved in cell wall biosynthesis
LAAAEPQDEIIVADDGSTDNTAQTLAEFGSRIVFVQCPHAGCGATRNRGVKMATRPLIALLDSDDEWDADKLQLQRTFMARKTDVLFCFSDFRCSLPSGQVSHNYLAQWHRDPRGWDDILGPGSNFSSVAALPNGRSDFRVHIGSIYLGEMESNYVAASTVLVRREQAGQALEFAEDVEVSHDKDCFGRLAKKGPAAYFDCETATQFGHDGPRITDANDFVFATTRLKILERVWGSDQDFLAEYGDRLQLALRTQHLRRARWLLVRGRTAEAKEDLRLAGNTSLAYRMLAALPGPAARFLLRARRLARGKARFSDADNGKWN